MDSKLSEDIVHFVVENATEPYVLRGFVDNWLLKQWNIDQWAEVFGDKTLPFRCLDKHVVSDEPCWERNCETKHMKFNEFLKKAETSDAKQWMYFDYKHMKEWFKSDSDLSKHISWKQFGYPDKGLAESTLWVGSAGAHTPAHQDTYGINIIAQLYGKKRWLLFPPESGAMKPTRVPYEESSVYSELNFYCPRNVDDFKNLTGCHMVEMSAGDALILPRGWWHYVQNLDPVNISVNVWLPHEKDDSTRVSEALIRLFVAQICKDLPPDTSRLLVNPNEDDLSDTPLTVLFLQLETVTNVYLNRRRKNRRAKRQKTCEETVEKPDIVYNLETVLENKKIEKVSSITSEVLVDLLKANMNDANVSEDGDDVDGVSKLRLTKALIDSYCDSNVLELVKQNLFQRLN